MEWWCVQYWHELDARSIGSIQVTSCWRGLCPAVHCDKFMMIWLNFWPGWEFKHKFKHLQAQSRLLWCFCFGLAIFTVVSPYRMGLEGYQYEHYPAAMFAAFSPILWGLVMCVAHWAICNDYAGWESYYFMLSFL